MNHRPRDRSHRSDELGRLDEPGYTARLAVACGLALLCGAITAAGTLAWLQGGAARADGSRTDEAFAVPAPSAVAADGAERLGPPPPPGRIGVLRGLIGRGETLHSTLTRLGVPGSTVLDIASAMRPVFDFRYAKAGDRFRLARRPDGSVVEFDYRTSVTEGYRLVRTGGGLVPRALEVDLLPRVEKLAGVVTTSLYNAIRNLGESGQLAHEFANLFAWDVDFHRDVRPGDEFRMLYERLYQRDGDGEEVYVRPGRILAAQYRGRGVHTAVFFDSEGGPSGYYRPDGSAVDRQFLRAPVKYTRISSSYSHSRLHPILKVRRPHLGIDFAAPRGAPVWSVADGVVTFRGRSGGFGNLVKVRHANGYVSYYGHLHRFAPGLAVGSRVEQKQVIGYVGSTGLSTGPHVDYRLRRGEQYVNPTTVRTPPADPIPAERIPEFVATRDAVLSELDPTPIASLGEAM